MYYIMKTQGSFEASTICNISVFRGQKQENGKTGALLKASNFICEKT